MHVMTTRASSVGRGALDGFETVTLGAGDLAASFAPGLGMAGVSLRHAGEELLDRRAGLSAYAERGAVMGIPILHPWANRLAGFDYDVDGVVVRLPDGPPLVRATIATTLTATGDTAVPVAFGFHPYLRLPGADRSMWLLDVPARRRLFADVRGIPTGDHEDEHAGRVSLGARSFDDGFDRIADGAAFSVAGGGRRLTVTFVSGYPAGQLFSPPGAQFVCFEPMTAPANVLRSGDGLRRVAPGSAFTVVFRIGVAGE